MTHRNRRLYQLNHCTYNCSYHIVWTPKYRGKVLASTYIKQELKKMFKYIFHWKGVEGISWHIGDDHIHLYIVIPPKYSVAYIVQIMKGKTSAWIKKKVKTFPRGSLWQRGYYVDTVGADAIAIRKYIENQEQQKVELKKLPLKYE